MQPQHMQALSAANRTRFAMSEIRRQVAAGETTAQEVIRDMPTGAASLEIGALLSAQPRWGKVKVRRFLKPFAINETYRVGSLTQRQADKLALALDVGVTGEGEEYAERWLAA